MKTRLVLITLILFSIGSIFVSKQGAADPGGVPAQIARLQATVDTIKNSLDHIDPTIIGETTLTTGMLYSIGDWIACSVVNVSETDVTVSISFVSAVGSVVHNSTLTLLPHRADGIIIKFTGFGHCRFNFSDAPNAIRANGGIHENLDGSVGSYKFVTDAR